LNAKSQGRLSPAQADVFASPRAKEELYQTSKDPLQLTNLAEAPAHASIKSRLSGVLDQWISETGDDVPDHISADSFDRETGASLKRGKKDFRGTPAGSQRNAAQIDLPGPR
jgi:hypothetical protein